MYGARHDLKEDFPEYQSTISQLKTKDPEFARLYAEYDGMDKKIYGITRQMQPVSDAYFGKLKKRRVLLKDQLFSKLKKCKPVLT